MPNLVKPFALLRLTLKRPQAYMPDCFSLYSDIAATVTMECFSNLTDTLGRFWTGAYILKVLFTRFNRVFHLSSGQSKYL